MELDVPAGGGLGKGGVRLPPENIVIKRKRQSFSAQPHQTARGNKSLKCYRSSNKRKTRTVQIIETIQQQLDSLFQEPLSGWSKRHLVFWTDEEKKFENNLDQLVLPEGVQLLVLTGTNNFAAKKELLHDNPNQSYLIYSPLSYETREDNWLRDIEKISVLFSADYWSIQMREFCIKPTPLMRQTVTEYDQFFKEKRFTAKLGKLGHFYSDPRQLHIDIMAILAGVPGGERNDILAALLNAEKGGESNLPLEEIHSFGNPEIFRKLVKTVTGYDFTDNSSVSEMAAHILITAQAHTMGNEPFRGLERCISESAKINCHHLVQHWRSLKAGNRQAFEICRQLEEELNLPARFAQLDADRLVKGDVFPAVDEAILTSLFEKAASGTVQPEQIAKICESRRVSGWYDRFENYYDALQQIGKIEEYTQKNINGFHNCVPKELWHRYTESAYLMDTYYRKFHTAFQKAMCDQNAVLDDPLKKAAEFTEHRYRDWFLAELGTAWSYAAAAELERNGCIEAQETAQKQENFYSTFIEDALKGRTNRVFVIISDALRYEIAAELRDRLNAELKGNADLKSMQAVFPSITKFGMAALLPHQEISVDQEMNVLVDGKPSRSTADRLKILETADPQNTALTAKEFRGWNQAERREHLTGKRAVYIYHDTIDAAGDNLPTEQKVFQESETAIREIVGLVRTIQNDLSGSEILITADHGFLYTYSPLNESAKVGKDSITGKLYESKKRYILAAPDAKSDFLLPVALKYAGLPMKGFTPRESIRIKSQGGGCNYVHGGFSLQEAVVPLISFRSKRSSSKNNAAAIPAEIALVSAPEKITSQMFVLQFRQTQPVGGKIKAAEWKVLMVDQNGTPVTEERKIIADKTGADDADRIFREKFNLVHQEYSNTEIYRLVITGENAPPQEIEFCIDIPLLDDYGF